MKDTHIEDEGIDFAVPALILTLCVGASLLIIISLLKILFIFAVATTLIF